MTAFRSRAPSHAHLARFAATPLLLFALATSVNAQQNLSFEILDPGALVPAGWSVPRAAADLPFSIDVDRAIARDGAHSLRITHVEDGDSTRVQQRIAIARIIANDRAANRVRLRGYLRSDNAAAGDAALWVRIDGPGGFIVVDSRAGGVSAPDASGWMLHDIQAPIPADALEVTFGAQLRGPGTAWFDALGIDTLDARTLPQPAAAARRYVEAALAVMKQHSLNRESIDWPQLEAATLDQARGSRSVSDAHLALRFALRGLGDRHSYLVTPQTAAALEVAPVSNARTGRKPIAPRGARLEAAFGYVSVPGFAGGTPSSQVEFAERIQSIIKELDSANTCGWILDLRENTGGNLWPMLAGIGPLLEEGEVGASVYPDGRTVPVWYRDGKAGFGDYVQLRVSGAPHRLSETAPLALLIGPATASSGEVLLMAFRGRENTATFGAPTRGLTTGNRTFALSDGAALVLTVAATSDRMGRIYDGSIAPDRLILEPDGAAHRAPDSAVLAAAVAWLQQQAAACNSAPSQ